MTRVDMVFRSQLSITPQAPQDRTHRIFSSRSHSHHAKISLPLPQEKWSSSATAFQKPQLISRERSPSSSTTHQPTSPHKSETPTLLAVFAPSLKPEPLLPSPSTTLSPSSHSTGPQPTREPLPSKA